MLSLQFTGTQAPDLPTQPQRQELDKAELEGRTHRERVVQRLSPSMLLVPGPPPQVLGLDMGVE